MEISRTVKAKIVDLQMMNLEVFRLFSRLGPKDFEKRIVRVNIVDYDRIFF
jgi:hypothetical protein